MAAVDNKHLIEILAVNHESGIGKKTGQPWEMWKAQCVIKGPDNSIKIGELTLSKSMKDTPPGRYLAEFELGVNFDNKVVPLLTKLHLHGDSAGRVPLSGKSSAPAA